MTTRLAALLALALALPGAAIAQSKTEAEIKVKAGAEFFDANCHRCHSPTADKASYGPPLENVLGRTAGTYEDYEYSEALAGSGIVWTDAALRAWMEDNDGFMPGTKMRHVGITDRTVQDFILAYLGSITTRDGSEIAK